MKTSTTVLIVGGVGLGGFLLLRYIQAKQAAASQDPCALIPNPYGMAACYAAKIGIPILSDVAETVESAVTGYDDDKRANEVNGVVTSINPVKLRFLGQPKWKRRFHIEGANMGTEEYRYTNGCVPAEGAPGWEKCQPGTVNVCRNPTAGPNYDWDCSKLGTKLPGDPQTQRIGELIQLAGVDWPWDTELVNCPPHNRYIVEGQLTCLDAALPGWHRIPRPDEAPEWSPRRDVVDHRPPPPPGYDPLDPPPPPTSVPAPPRVVTPAPQRPPAGSPPPPPPTSVPAPSRPTRPRPTSTPIATTKTPKPSTPTSPPIYQFASEAL